MQWPAQASSAYAVKPIWPRLFHAVAILDAQPKAVSSSTAHLRVVASSLYAKRPDLAAARTAELLALNSNQMGWQRAAELIRLEYQEMHQMFAEVGFEFLTPAARQLLAEIDQIWQTEGDGPWVTLDAGPNIHVLLRPDQHTLWQKLKRQHQRWITANEPDIFT